jgi:hypothetical protein
MVLTVTGDSDNSMMPDFKATALIIERNVFFYTKEAC